MSKQKFEQDKRERTLRLKAAPSPITPRDHQLAAWDKMTALYLEQKKNAGLIVVPTGGGKTVLAAHWLLQNHVQQGGRVLWLAHRRSLLRQAFDTFCKLANAAAPKPQLGLINISSDQARWSEVDETRDVIFSSMQTAVLETNRGFVEELVDSSGGGVFVVVDEAHHAPAPGYKRLLKILKKKGCRLLGLTATPVRMVPEDQDQLWHLFDGTIVYQISRQELTNRDILATPDYETVKTEVNLEREFTSDDLKHIERYGEIGPQVLKRLSRHSMRNKLIVEHYQKKKDIYGPTIVFAGDTLHAQTLAEEFKKVGVDADHVDYSRKDAQRVIEQFQKQKKPDVLVNVEMLTEGFDAPHTRTVFIARPTMSESLVAQMVGRALRGKQSGGNEVAHLVTFLDTWEQFNVVDTAYAAGEGADSESAESSVTDRQSIPIPAQLVQDAYHLLQSNVKGHLVGVYQCLPHGWYMWEELFEDDLQRRTVTIFENQRAGLEKLLSTYGSPEQVPEEITEEDARALIRKFFADVPDPLPRWHDIKALLDARRKGCDLRACTMDDKRAFDPRELAKKILEQGLNMLQKRQLLEPLWQKNPICKLVYRDNFHAFLEDVSREEALLASPPTEAPSADIVKITPKDAPRAWPQGKSGYNLIEIRDAVQAGKRHFPQGAPQVQEIQWTRSPTPRWWGFFRYSDKNISINRVLNSPDIPRFVLEFLMFHELLHADMPSAGHNRDFRARERLFQPSSEAQRDAQERGIKVGSSIDFWRVRADMFLDTFRKKWVVAEPGAEINY